MAIPLQPVQDQAADQNFRQVGERFPLQPGDLADKVVGPKHLAPETFQRFLQLLVPANSKVAIGEDTWTWPGATSVSTSKSVSHGLEGTPTFVAAIGTSNGEFAAYHFLQSRSSTTIGLSGVANISPAAGKTMKFLWIAIG